MKNKKTIICMYIILALPIPISLLTWIGTMVSIANIGMIKADNAGVLITTIVSLSAMILAGIYPATYGISLFRTLRNRRLKLVSFLPIIHILLIAILILLWSLCE